MRLPAALPTVLPFLTPGSALPFRLHIRGRPAPRGHAATALSHRRVAVGPGVPSEREGHLVAGPRQRALGQAGASGTLNLTLLPSSVCLGTNAPRPCPPDLGTRVCPVFPRSTAPLTQPPGH